ncbi:MAG: ABC transporter permease [Chloroflexi bacterium OLB13]|nr:MAG: ABC transporter permease [Chloroflexi bacterium OLB13]
MTVTEQHTTASTSSSASAKGWLSYLRHQRTTENITGWLFVAPAVILIFIFGIFPIGYAAYMSIHTWRIRQGAILCDPEAADVIALVRSCLSNYETAVLGDWGGAALFALGLVVLFGAYLVWTRLFSKRDGAIFAVLRFAAGLVVIAVAMTLISQGYNTMIGALRTRDQAFLKGLQITIYYAFGSIPLQLGLGLLLAYVLHSRIKAKALFRTIFFLPYVTPAVAAAVVFGTVFSARATSPMNQLVQLFGGDVQRWLAEPRPFLNVVFGLNLEGFIAGPSMALVVVIILGIWTYTGYNAVIFMAGLGNIPKDLYEAARVDGATDWHIFRYVTMPLLSPVTFYLSILGFIGTFTAFNTLFVMRTPTNAGTLDTSALVIFDTFRAQNRWAEATAQAIVLLLLVLAMTQIQRSLLEKRVFYG